MFEGGANENMHTPALMTRPLAGPPSHAISQLTGTRFWTRELVRGCRLSMVSFPLSVRILT
jgi:hypothetical protein